MKSCEAATRRFSEQFGEIPGVLMIDMDGFFSNSILVFYDKKKLASVLPSEFEGFPVSFYDVKYISAAAKQFLAYAKDLDKSAPENKSAYEYFTRANEICTEMLSK